MIILALVNLLLVFFALYLVSHCKDAIVELNDKQSAQLTEVESKCHKIQKQIANIEQEVFERPVYDYGGQGIAGLEQEGKNIAFSVAKFHEGYTEIVGEIEQRIIALEKGKTNAKKKETKSNRKNNNLSKQRTKRARL